MNRRMRNRMSGGVGGREPRGSLLPDFFVIVAIQLLVMFDFDLTTVVSKDCGRPNQT